jgi:predicted acylesterase/phospholipase RssA
MHHVPIEVVQAVRASTAIPFAYRHEPIQVRPDDQPYPVHGYWDGGVTACLPITPLTELAHYGVTEKPDFIIAVDATGASDPAGQDWLSIDDMSVLDMAEAMVKGLVDDHNEMQFDVAKAYDIPVYPLKITKSASMSDPGGTIPPAYYQAKEDVQEFMLDLWDKGVLHY